VNRLLISSRTIRPATAAVLSLVVGLGAACTDDGTPGPTGKRSTGSSKDVVLLVSGTATEPRPALLAMPTKVLLAAAGDRSVSDGTDGMGSSARVMAAADTYTATFPLTPRRRDGSVEYGLNRDNLIDANVKQVKDAVEDVLASEEGLDLLRAIDDATRGAPPATLIIVSHGLSTTGGFDLRLVGWDGDPQALAKELDARGLLPALTGWRVIFSGLGSTTGAQAPLPRPLRLKLVAYWTAICVAAGGACEIDDAQMEPVQPATTVAMPTVSVPGIDSVVGPRGEVTYTVTDKLLGFPGDSADLSPNAVEYLKFIAGQIRVRLQGKPKGTVTVTGYCADPPGSTRDGMLRLSRARAENVARVLRESGVDNPIVATGGGVAPGESATQGGRFNETRAEEMRRVEITVQAAT
jgi:outer membrane protein OmpA-like peptidoglycan-associated protein